MNTQPTPQHLALNLYAFLTAVYGPAEAAQIFRTHGAPLPGDCESRADDRPQRAA